MISQIIILVIGFLIAFLISKSKLSIWRNILGFILGFLVAWIGGGVFVVWLFVSSNFTEALVSVLSKGVLFAIVGAGSGIYCGRKIASQEIVTEEDA